MRQQLERVDVAGLDQAEVAVIERGDLRLVEALGDGDDGGVDKADVGVGVLTADLPHADIVFAAELENGQSALRDLSKKRRVSVSRKAFPHQIVKLYEN